MKPVPAEPAMIDQTTMRAMTNRSTMQFRSAVLFAVVFLLTMPVPALAQERDLTLEFTSAQSKIDFTLDAAWHTVHGTFDLKSSTIHFNPATGAINGEILVDAESGKSGNSVRDAKMRKDVLETDRYREITFLPDRTEGKVAPVGKSTVQVHGVFGIHGSVHEITIPVQVEMAPGGWTATAHFAIPYAQWGMKNPSNFILRVGSTVDIDMHAAGAATGSK
jgi:polyisoprenoid-binding protein YceI